MFCSPSSFASSYTRTRGPAADESAPPGASDLRSNPLPIMNFYPFLRKFRSYATVISARIAGTSSTPIPATGARNTRDQAWLFTAARTQPSRGWIEAPRPPCPRRTIPDHSRREPPDSGVFPVSVARTSSATDTARRHPTHVRTGPSSGVATGAASGAVEEDVVAVDTGFDADARRLRDRDRERSVTELPPFPWRESHPPRGRGPRPPAPRPRRPPVGARSPPPARPRR